MALPRDVLTKRVYKGMTAHKLPVFTEEEMECIRVCVANAPIPYDISKKKIPGNILQKIGQPTREKHEGMPTIECDLTKYDYKFMDSTDTVAKQQTAES